VLVLIILTYPLLRTYDIIPVRQVAAAATMVSEARGGSFAYRVRNEDRLLAKANQKPLLGWGTWGRNRIYNEESGADESITDGGWIIRFGMFGWLGYLTQFGLFAAAIFSARSTARGPVTSASIMLGGLTLILVINLADLVPNANLLSLTFLLAGSIAGRSRIAARVRTVKPAASGRRATTEATVPV
jgi:hypothetical protein